MRRYLGPLAAGVLFVVTLSGAASTIAHPAPRAPTRTAALRWGRCPDPNLQGAAQCADLAVPLDYADPGAQQIHLAVSRVVHTSGPYRGVILVNPGGPGASGRALNAALVNDLLSEGLGRAADEYDWIGFDPRGVGASRPALTCIPGYFGPHRPSYLPTTHAGLAFWLSASRRYARACASKSPLQAALLRHMTTPDLARDMDQIRKALGQRQISYYGFSYGTYLGQVYATLFPGSVRRLILDSNVDPTRVPYRAFNLDQDIPFNRNENLWFAWLAKFDSVYHLGQTGRAVRSMFYATARHLRGHPAGGVVGPDEWLDVFLGAGYYEQTWGDLGAAFAGWVHHHDPASADALVQLYRSQDTPGEDNSYAAYLAVGCTDAPWPTHWSTWSRDIRRLNRIAPFGTWQNAWFNAPCIYWPAPPATAVHVNGIRVASALLIDETLDAATPFSGSLVVRRLFPHSVLLAEPGGTSHADSLSGDLCVDRTIADYLLRGVLPARKRHRRWDKACVPLPAPPPGSAIRSRRTVGEPGIPGPPYRFGLAP
jgi:pimeloyl-ACP methyl ester carboxylesterase